MCIRDSLKSVGFPMDTVDTADLNVQEAEKERSASLIRGVCARLKALGYEAVSYTHLDVYKRQGTR